MTLASTLIAADDIRLISADLSRAQGPFDRMENLCVGAGRANEGLRADWQRQLAEVSRE